MSVSHRQDDPEKDKFISRAMIMLIAGICVLVTVCLAVTVIILNGDDSGTADDLYWRNPMLTFNSEEMNGSTVISAIQSLRDCSTEIYVVTGDGHAETYNYSGNKFVPSYVTKGIDEAGYINPGASFTIEGVSDSDGKVRKIIVRQK